MLYHRVVKTKEERLHLKWICKGILGKEREELSQQEENKRNVSLSKVLPAPSLPLLSKLVSFSSSQRFAVAKLFLALSYDGPLRGVLPHNVGPKLSEFLAYESIDKFKLDSFLAYVKKEIFLLGPLLSAFYNGYHIEKEAIDLLKYLCLNKSQIHANDIEAGPSSPMDGTYNPTELGRALYFEGHGQQIRTNRKFQMDKDGENKKDQGNDDTPDSKCKKLYSPRFNTKGVSALHLHFCPLHGHC